MAVLLLLELLKLQLFYQELFFLSAVDGQTLSLPGGVHDYY